MPFDLGKATNTATATKVQNEPACNSNLAGDLNADRPPPNLDEELAMNSLLDCTRQS